MEAAMPAVSSISFINMMMDGNRAGKGRIIMGIIAPTCCHHPMIVITSILNLNDDGAPQIVINRDLYFLETRSFNHSLLVNPRLSFQTPETIPESPNPEQYRCTLNPKPKSPNPKPQTPKS